MRAFATFGSSGIASPKLAQTLALLAMVCIAPSTWAQGVSIDDISPKSARRGETVTINGRGFGALNVQVTVGGSSAPLLSANGNQVTFRVPEGVKPGLTQVTARNPGFQAGSIAFRMLEGILLPGNASAPVKDATFDIPPVAVGEDEIQNGILLTRLDLRMAPNAAVGVLNNALVLVEGGIVSMAKGFGYVTIAIPKPSSLSALQVIIRTLNSATGVAGAFLATEAVPQELPTTADSFSDRQLLPTRFPAAWNAVSLAKNGCESRRVRVLVADDFLRPAPSSLNGFSTEVPNFTILPPENGDAKGFHGYDVTTTLGSLFNDVLTTGANPFSQCLEITGVQMAGITPREQVDRIIQNVPANGDPFILNYSMAFNGACVRVFQIGGAFCDPDSVLGTTGLIRTAYSRADVAEYWKARTFDRWERFLVTPAAGNWKDEFAATIYPGLEFAQYQSVFSIATGSDPFFPFISNEFLWSSATGVADPSLVATPPEIRLLTQQIISDGMDKVAGEDNVLMTGSTSPGATFNDLKESSFSNIGPDVTAVGEAILAIDTIHNGTSFAAPQVAGLASYLWLLSDDLRNNHPASVTRTAILENSRSTFNANHVIDAYAAVLSLDATDLPTPETAPVRPAILDLNHDGTFDQADIAGFVGILFDSNGNPRQPTTPDYSRFDLNGDGFTGGPRTERFDLDRAGSTQYGATRYTPGVPQMIEEDSQTFDETAITDADVLCYYAYSAMYRGDPNVRKTLLEDTVAPFRSNLPA